MEQKAKATGQFKPKWRHFHAQSTVWVQNILSHDVEFQVADEHNNPYKYVLPQGKVCELPGGAVATLGVKKIVDELIQNNKSEVLRIWEPSVRQKYEDDIILRIKEAPLQEERTAKGQIDLSVADDREDSTEPVDEPPKPKKPEDLPPGGDTYEPAFPTANRGAEEAKKAAAAAAAGLQGTKVIDED